MVQNNDNATIVNPITSLLARLTSTGAQVGSSINTIPHPELGDDQNTCLIEITSWLQKRIIHEHSPRVFSAPEQLLLLIHGGPGTGKSRLASAVYERMEGTMQCGAFTGNASTHIPNGRTLHSLLNIPIHVRNSTSLRPLTPTQRVSARERLKGLLILWIDEISMISAQFFHFIDLRLREIGMSSILFGENSIILSGDMFQIPPTSGTSLYKAVMDFYQVHQGRADAGTGSEGAQQFCRFQLRELKQQYRASADPAHTAILERCRDPSITHPVNEEVCRYLREHILTNSQVRRNPEWATSPIVVTSNEVRGQLNLVQAIEFAKRSNRVVYRWPKRMKGLRVRENAEEVAGLLTDLHDSCPLSNNLFVQGAPCYLTWNVNARKGLAHGTKGYLHSLVFEDGFQEEDILVDPLTGERASAGDIIDLPRQPQCVVIRFPDLPMRTDGGTGSSTAYVWDESTSLSATECVLTIPADPYGSLIAVGNRKCTFF